MTARAMRRSLRRLELLGLLFGLLFVLLAARLVQLAVIERAGYERWALQQHHRLVELPAARGSIYARGGELLAISVDADSIFATPAEMRDPARAAEQLAPLLGRSGEELLAALSSSRSFVWLARQVTPELAHEVHALGLAGVRFLKESRRFYPKRELAGHLLGFVGMDGRGIEGIEKVFDGALRGHAGRKLTEIDARQRPLYSREQVLEPAASGGNLVLTLDVAVQHIAERELERAVAEQRALGGVVVVLDPKLGDVLALAHAPRFDPNRFASSSAEQWRNRGVTDLFEPGSTLKPFIVAGCLELGLCAPDEIVDCEMGSLRVGGHTFEDHKPFGRLTVAEVLEHSSNIGAMKLGLRLGRERLYESLRALRFGERLGVLPQEAAGRLQKPGRWSATSIAALSMGYEILVTPLQLAAAYAALANDGLLIRPRVVLSPGELQPPEALGRVLSARTARSVRAMLRTVVERGTGKAGRSDQVSAAGKTGTAKKLDPATGRYSPTAVRATFVGMVPAEEPELVVLVTLDEPRVQPWGGLAAAPVFKAIAEQALASRRARPAPQRRSDAAPPQRERERGRDTGTEAHGRVSDGRFANLLLGRCVAGSLRPCLEKIERPEQLLGLGMREALREARRAGWIVRASGSGYARSVRIEQHDDRSQVLVLEFESSAPLPRSESDPELGVEPIPAPGRDG